MHGVVVLRGLETWPNAVLQECSNRCARRPLDCDGYTTWHAASHAAKLSLQRVRLKIRRSRVRFRVSAMHEGDRHVHFGPPTLVAQNTCNRRRRAGTRPTSGGIDSRCKQRESRSISDLVEEHIVALNVARFHFPADAICRLQQTAH